MLEMILDRKELDWSSSDILMQLVKNIKEPLTSIIDANEESSRLIATNSLNMQTSDVIFSSSQEIADLIDEVVKIANGTLVREKTPDIFEIYHSNEKVKSMCKNPINPNKISKEDSSWLLKIEEEVYENISRKDLNLYDLSYSLVVSERQLHRKIRNLLHLTPNKYIRVLKLNKAKQFIDDYIYGTISQIAYAVGYNDTHYFSKLFEQQYGVSPKELLSIRKS